MIVGAFHVVGGAAAPCKTNPPWVVDPNAVLPLAVSAQAFQTVAGRRRQNPQIVGRIKQIELAKRQTFDGRETSGWGGDEKAAPSPPTERIGLPL